jgi:hypothetical protein
VCVVVQAPSDLELGFGPAGVMDARVAVATVVEQHQLQVDVQELPRLACHAGINGVCCNKDGRGREK